MVKGLSANLKKKKKIEDFIYLDVLIDKNEWKVQEIQARVAKWNQKYGNLNTLMKLKKSTTQIYNMRV